MQPPFLNFFVHPRKLCTNHQHNRYRAPFTNYIYNLIKYVLENNHAIFPQMPE